MLFVRGNWSESEENEAFYMINNLLLRLHPIRWTCSEQIPLVYRIQTLRRQVSSNSSWSLVPLQLCVCPTPALSWGSSQSSNRSHCSLCQCLVSVIQVAASCHLLDSRSSWQMMSRSHHRTPRNSLRSPLPKTTYALPPLSIRLQRCPRTQCCSVSSLVVVIRQRRQLPLAWLETSSSFRFRLHRWN